ncbi:MAG: DEAD/DEAH box helicase family protein [Wolbachia sp.]
MCSISNQDKQVIIKNLEKIDSELKGESKRFGNSKESMTVGRRNPVVDGVLEHLKSPSTTNYNIMIDAETGFGKTYDIGLYSYVLAQAGFHHLVAVPNNNLVNQAKKMIGDAFSLRIETPETTQGIEDLLKNTEHTTIIITHDLLLQQKDGQKLGNRSGKKPKLWISIDEADSISQQQAFENMCQLDRKYPTTYLTATTKRRILSRCGKIISPARSSRCCIVDTIKTTGIIKNNGEKFGRILAASVALYVISSIALFPIINIHVTAIAAQIGFTSNLRLYLFLINSSKYIISVIVFFMITAPIMWVFSKIVGVELKQLFLRAFANLFEVLSSKCKSSPAHEYIEKCKETFYHKKLVDTDDLLTSVRWNIQSPTGENALILTYDLDSIMNLISIFQGKDDEVYENGKTYTRYSIYNLCKHDKMLTITD